jgi:hypothetical protein
MKATILMTVIGALVSACTHVMYDGPRRPQAEVAIIASREVLIHTVDGRPVGGDSDGTPRKLEVLPGNYVLGVSLSAVRSHFLYNTLHRSGVVKICVPARAGRTYVVRANLGERRWTPELLDSATRLPVKTPCGPAGDDD